MYMYNICSNEYIGRRSRLYSCDEKDAKIDIFGEREIIGVIISGLLSAEA